MLGLMLYHGFLLALYTHYRMGVLVVLNIASVLIYAGCVIAAWLKLKAIVIMRVCFGEIIVQAFVAGVMLGKECGFQFYLLALTCIVFYMSYIYQDNDKFNAMHYVLAELAAFILMQVITAYIEPIYTFRDSWMVGSLYNINFFSALIVVVLSLSTLLAQIVHLEDRLLQKNKDLETLSRTDALTGLANRRSIEEKYKYVMEHSRTYAVIMGDIDDFKKVNDRYGHNTGDQVLRQVADIFRSSVRGDDMVCRWGGEEILVFLPFCKKEGASLTAKRILDKINSTCVLSPEGEKISISMTLGVADSTEGKEFREVIQKADVRLYDGKAKGKNCIVCEHSVS